MQLHDTSKTGANKPLVVKTVDVKTGVNNEYYLKYKGGETMGDDGSGRELLASFLAAQLEINIPPPAIVIVGEDFLSTLTGHPEYSKIKESKGINFGSENIIGNMPIVQRQLLTPNQEQQAARIFVFDILLKHSDRTTQKPNMFVANDQIIIIDHEKSFGFLLTLPSRLSPNPWELNDWDVNEAKKHFFYTILKNNRRIDWDDAYSTFDNLNENFWQRAKQLTPKDWMTDQDFEKIQKHITLIQQNFEPFKSEIWTKLKMQ